MNQGLYQTLLTPQFQFHLPKDRDEAADAMTNAYHLSNIGQTTTPFGAPLLNADKSILKTFIKLSLDINFYGGQIQSKVSEVIETIRGAVQAAQRGITGAVKDAQKFVNKQIDNLVSSLPAPLLFISPILKGLVGGIFKDLLGSSNNAFAEVYKCMKKLEGIIDLLDVSKIAYFVMSTGYCLYWITAKMSPVPPMPPCIAPTTGPIILLPGLPTPLNSDLAKTFTKGNTVPQAIGKLYNSLISHQLTVAGIYLGIIPFFPSPIPGPPIPWFSMLNIPFPSISFSKPPGDPNSSGSKKQKERQEKIDKDPNGEFIKAGEKLKKAKDALKKQADNSKPC
jgi:hypothetical protein